MNITISKRIYELIEIVEKGKLTSEELKAISIEIDWLHADLLEFAKVKF